MAASAAPATTATATTATSSTSTTPALPPSPATPSSPVPIPIVSIREQMNQQLPSMTLCSDVLVPVAMPHIKPASATTTTTTGTSQPSSGLEAAFTALQSHWPTTTTTTSTTTPTTSSEATPARQHSLHPRTIGAIFNAWYHARPRPPPRTRHKRKRGHSHSHSHSRTTMELLELRQSPAHLEAQQVISHAVATPRAAERASCTRLTVASTHDYLVPPDATFVLGDVQGLRDLRRLGVLPAASHDLVTADPPWDNASVSRARLYRTQSVDALIPMLASLPVAPLLAPRGLVVVWITHAPAALESVVGTLLPRWGCAHVATLRWLKVTAGGQPVVPPSVGGRRPFELAIVGQLGDSSHRTAPKCGGAGGGAGAGASASGSAADEPSEVPLLDFAAVPVTHSVKPPVQGVLEHYGLLQPRSAQGAKARRLELFARRLQQGWTSVGHQALMFQSAAMYRANNSSATHTSSHGLE